jgi:hypothetical protein
MILLELLEELKADHRLSRLCQQAVDLDTELDALPDGIRDDALEAAAAAFFDECGLPGIFLPQNLFDMLFPFRYRQLQADIARSPLCPAVLERQAFPNIGHGYTEDTVTVPGIIRSSLSITTFWPNPVMVEALQVSSKLDTSSIPEKGRPVV